MHSKSDNIDIMINDNTDVFIEELFQSDFSRYQITLETSIKRSDFTFDHVHLLNYKSYKINFKHGRAYIDSPN